MAERVWRTRDGRKIPIREMTDDHLANAILFLRRAHAKYLAFVLENPPSFQGEMAQYYADQEWTEAATSGPKDLYPIFDDLVFEMEKRSALKEKRR